MRAKTPLHVIKIMAVAMETDAFPFLPSGPAEVNKMIKDHGDLFSDSQCKICSAVLISESQKLTHYQSKKHANKVRRYFSVQSEEPTLKKLKTSTSETDSKRDPDWAKVCNLCKMTFTSPVVAETHYSGKVHSKNLRLKNVASQTPVASPTPPAAPPKKKPADIKSAEPAANDSNNPDRFCSICQASFNNPLMAQQHYVGKKHRKQMTKRKLMETYGPSAAPASTLKGYPCTICNIELNSVEQYQSHISGAKHKNQVKKTGLNTANTENKETADQSFTSDNQYATVDFKYAPENDQYATGDDQYATGDDQYATGDDQYAAGDDQYASGDNQYAPEDTEYTEEYQFT